MLIPSSYLFRSNTLAQASTACNHYRGYTPLQLSGTGQNRIVELRGCIRVNPLRFGLDGIAN